MGGCGQSLWRPLSSLVLLTVVADTLTRVVGGQSTRQAKVVPASARTVVYPADLDQSLVIGKGHSLSVFVRSESKVESVAV